jgi:hypothetical protein
MPNNDKKIKKITSWEIVFFISGLVISIVSGILGRNVLVGVIVAIVWEFVVYIINQLRLTREVMLWWTNYPDISKIVRRLINSIDGKNRERARSLLIRCLRQIEYEPFTSELAETLKICYRSAQNSIIAVATYEINWWFMPQSSFYLANHMLISLKHYLKEVSTNNDSVKYIWRGEHYDEVINYLKGAGEVPRKFLSARLFIYSEDELNSWNAKPTKEEVDFFLAMHKFAQIAPIIIKKEEVNNWLNSAEITKALEPINKVNDDKHREAYNRFSKNKLQDFALIDRDIVINVFEENQIDQCRIYITKNCKDRFPGRNVIVSDNIVNYFVTLTWILLENIKNNSNSEYIFQEPRLSRIETVEAMRNYYVNNFTHGKI